METTELDNLLMNRELNVVFQPIFCIHGGSYRLFALEALIRGPEGYALEFPDAIFPEVRRRHLEVKADRACIAAIVNAAAELPNLSRLFINVHAVTLAEDSEFALFLQREVIVAGLHIPSIVVEITEYGPEIVGGAFLNGLENLRYAGFKIAVDDIGAGHSNLRKVLDCCPDYLKIDRYFVSQCHKHTLRQALLRSVATLGRGYGGQVIAEGVEHIEELNFLGELGISLIQGFLLAMPLSGEQLIAHGYLDGKAHDVVVSPSEPVCVQNVARSRVRP